MRILTLTSQYPPHYYGGYELTCRDVMDRFRRWGHEVVVLTSSARVPGVADVAEPGVHRTLTPEWDWERNRLRLPSTPVGRWSLERRAVRTVRALLEQVRPDVVSVWHMIGIPLSPLAYVQSTGVPMVVTVGNDWLIQAPLFDGWQRLWRWLPPAWPHTVAGVPVGLPSLRTATVNFVSAFTRQRALDDSPWALDPDAPVVRPGVDLGDFPIEPRPNRRWQWRLLYVGRLDVTKGIGTLIHAFARMPDTARLDLVGRGPASYRAELARLAEQLGVADRVRFDSCSRNELRARYREADVVVFPSEWDEPFGVVPLEAMACGVPVVATGTGGSGEFLEDGENCLVFPRADPTALRESVARLAEDGGLRDRLVTAGRRTAGTLTIDNYADELLGLHAASAERADVPGRSSAPRSKVPR